MDLADSTSWSRGQPPNVVRNFCQAYCDCLQDTACFDDRVLGALGFEVVHGFTEMKPGHLRQMLNCPSRKFRMCIDARTHGRSSQGQFLQAFPKLLKTPDAELRLSSIPAEFLT